MHDCCLSAALAVSGGSSALWMGSWVEKMGARHVEADELRRGGIGRGREERIRARGLCEWTKEGVRKVA